MVMIECYPEYWDFVRKLRMEERVAHGFIEKADITIEQQINYMSKHWHEYFICLIDGQPVGFVGSVDGDIRVCTSPEFQKRGIAKFMISYIIDKFPNSFAKVKIDNEASIKSFESCGFTKQFYVLKK
jgi:RimJ/RimL family protein N-acetyltransferase